MYIYHKSPKLLSCCLWRKPRFTDKDMQEWLSTVSSWINHHHTNLLIKFRLTKWQNVCCVSN
jgi:hypothetical protein